MSGSAGGRRKSTAQAQGSNSATAYPAKDGETMSATGKISSSQKRYPPELKERGVRMVAETIEAQGGERHGVITWVAQAEVDGGSRPGTTTEDRRRIADLEKEVRELRRANEILRAAATFFARELDPRLPK